MSQGTELLNSLTEEQISTYTSDPSTEEHIIVGSDRFITVPDSLKRIAVQRDHNIETVTFDCPRYWDDIDMSVMTIYINYVRSDNAPGSSIAENVVATGDIMHFTWTITQHITEVAGPLKIQICINKIGEDGFEENHWNSEINEDMTVSKGLPCGNQITEAYPDVIGQILYRLDAIGGITGGLSMSAGEFTIPVDLWRGQYTVDMIIPGLGESDAIFFTPATRADKNIASDVDLFVATGNENVTFSVNTIPTSDILLRYLIIHSPTYESADVSWGIYSFGHVSLGGNTAWEHSESPYLRYNGVTYYGFSFDSIAGGDGDDELYLYTEDEDHFYLYNATDGWLVDTPVTIEFLVEPNDEVKAFIETYGTTAEE